MCFIILTDPRTGENFSFLLTENWKCQVSDNSCAMVNFLPYDHSFCFPDKCSKKNLLGASNTTSPWNAEMRLYCRVIALKSEVLNGDPSLGSAG